MSADETRAQDAEPEQDVVTSPADDAKAETPPPVALPIETAVFEAVTIDAAIEAPPVVAETTPEPPVAEPTPEAAPVAESAPEVPNTEAPAATETPAEETRRRPRLNPTIDTAEAKPVSSIEPGTALPPTTPAKTDEEVAADKAKKVPQAAPPVELPSTQQTIDAAMEAEIEAALSSGDLDTAQVVSVKAKDVDQDDDAEATTEPITEETLEEGMQLTGKIQSIHGDDVFIDLGLRSPGVVQKRQFTKGRPAEIGQVIAVSVANIDEEEGLIQLNLPHGLRKVAAGDWDALTAGQTIDCVVTKKNKGGLEVTVGSLRGFMPAGQVEMGFVSDLESYVGQQLRAQIIEANQKKRNLVVSRRAHLMEERKAGEAELWEKITVGQNFPGKITTLKDYGAFIDIGGADGFLHIGEISWSRINKPSDVLQVGQEVEVQVISLDKEKKKIGLGMRQLVTNPWTAVTMNYPAESTVAGKVTRIADFGAFVELEPGVEGLVHISELDYARVHRVADVLKVGQEIEAKVTSVDPDKRRIGLSIKALKTRPEVKGGKKRVSDADLAPGAGEKYERQRKGPLKGGMGTDSGSLFGNPSDFK